MGNERNAGRKKACADVEIEKAYERHLLGETVSKLADEYGVSRQTMSTYFARIAAKESAIQVDVEDGRTTVYKVWKYWQALNNDFVKAGVLKAEDLKNYAAKYTFMNDDTVMTDILVDFASKKIAILNHSTDILYLAFGVNINPGWDDFIEFIEDRCFPASRDRIKSVLKDLGLDSYDIFAIVDKTHGVMAEDHQWFKIAYFDRGMI